MGEERPIRLGRGGRARRPARAGGVGGLRAPASTRSAPKSRPASKAVALRPSPHPGPIRRTAGSIHRRLAAENGLIAIWVYVARGDEQAADGVLGRIGRALRTLADNPLIGRARPGLAPGLRSSVIGGRIAFCRPTDEGIDLVRVLGGAMDVRADDVR